MMCAFGCVRAELRQERAHTLDDAQEIDAEDPRPVVVVRVVEVGARHHARVVDQQLRRAELALRGFSERGPRGLQADVSRVRQSLAASGLDGRHRLGEAVRVDISKYDTAVAGAERHRDGASDTTRCARNDGHTPFDVQTALGHRTAPTPAAPPTAPMIAGCPRLEPRSACPEPPSPQPKQ